MKLALYSLILCASAFVPPGDSVERPLDTVTLTGKGKPLEGRLVQVTATELQLKVKSKLKTIERSKVEEFQSINQDLMSLMPDLSKVCYAIETSGMKALAESCEARHLPGEAQLVWWNVLRLDPGNEEAHTALSHRKVGEDWQFKLAGKSLTLEKLKTFQPEWSKAFELSTSHFDVKSSLPWRETVRAAVMAEEIYTALYFTFGADFDFYWPEGILTLELHGDDTFAGGADLRATVDVDGRRASFDFAKGFQPWLFARHMDELLIAQAVKESGKGRANLPVWLAIGMEESLQAYLDLIHTDAKAVDFNPDRDHGLHRSIHAAAAEPYGVSRVINFGGNDFRNASKELQRAQAYTLIAYLRVGDGGKYHQGLKAYVQSVLNGGGSSTDLFNCLGIKNQREERAFEEAWFAWVKAL